MCNSFARAQSTNANPNARSSDATTPFWRSRTRWTRCVTVHMHFSYAAAWIDMTTRLVLRFASDPDAVTCLTQNTRLRVLSLFVCVGPTLGVHGARTRTCRRSGRKPSSEAFLRHSWRAGVACFYSAGRACTHRVYAFPMWSAVGLVHIPIGTAHRTRPCSRRTAGRFGCARDTHIHFPNGPPLRIFVSRWAAHWICVRGLPARARRRATPLPQDFFCAFDSYGIAHGLPEAIVDRALRPIQTVLHVFEAPSSDLAQRYADMRFPY